MDEANTLAYYDTATITAVKSFIVQDPEVWGIGVKQAHTHGATTFSTTTFYLMTLSLRGLSATQHT
jgi:hypothetical protein